MHRAAYLLYRHRGHISANNLLIFSPNEVFADYISNVLPELGEENIREATFDDYARSILGKKIDVRDQGRADGVHPVATQGTADYALRTASIAFKSSAAFLRMIRSYARHLQAHQPAVRGHQAQRRARCCRDGRQEALLGALLGPADHGRHRAAEGPRAVASATYSSDDRRAQDRARGGEGDGADATRSGSTGTCSRTPRWSGSWPRATRCRRTCDRICKLTYKSLRGKQHALRGRRADPAPEAADRRRAEIRQHPPPDHRRGPGLHPVHFEIIRNLFGESSMTILGDLSQRINPYSGIESYDALGEVFGRDAQERREADQELQVELGDIGVRREHAAGRARARTTCAGAAASPGSCAPEAASRSPSLISAEMDQLKAEGMASIAVICKTADEAFRVYSKLLPDARRAPGRSDSITFHHGLVVLPVYLAKGLEFDAVIIHDAGDSVYGSESERKLLYTACTRALHSLTVYYAGEPSPLLPMERGGL